MPRHRHRARRPGRAVAVGGHRLAPPARSRSHAAGLDVSLAHGFDDGAGNAAHSRRRRRARRRQAGARPLASSDRRREHGTGAAAGPPPGAAASPPARLEHAAALVGSAARPRTLPSTWTRGPHLGRARSRPRPGRRRSSALLARRAGAAALRPARGRRRPPGEAPRAAATRSFQAAPRSRVSSSIWASSTSRRPSAPVAKPGSRFHERDAAVACGVPRSIACRTASVEAGHDRNAVAPLSKARLRSGSVGVLVTTTTAVAGEPSRMRRRSRRSLAARGRAARKSACTAPLGEHGSTASSCATRSVA